METATARRLVPSQPPLPLQANHRAGRVPTGAGVGYLIELADPATGEVPTTPTLAAYQQFRHDDAATPAA